MSFRPFARLFGVALLLTPPVLAEPPAEDAPPTEAPADAGSKEPPVQVEPKPEVPAAALPVATPIVEPIAPEPAPPAPEEPAPEVPAQGLVITGSRINRKDLTTAAPVAVLLRQQLTQTGKASVGDVLQALPAQSNAVNTQYNNGGDGSTRVDLRGLGSARTLVLLNGRRFVAGGLGADASVDLNAIPMAAVERIEILKDGASAVYGSDAIGGVVNIITRKEWEGSEANLLSGVSQRGDGFLFDASVAAGRKAERSSYLVTAGYSRQEPVWSGDREWSRYDREYDYACTDAAEKAGECERLSTAGSSAIPGGYVRDYGEGGGNDAWKDLQAQDTTGDGTYTRDQKTGAWRPLNGNGVYPEFGDLYNYQSDNYLVTPQERLTFFAQGDQLLGEDTKLYYEASFTNRRSEQKLAPEPLFTSDTGLIVSKDNAYNPFGRDFTDVRRRLVEFGRRSFEQDVTTYRLVGGLTGKVARDSSWTWDASLNYGRTTGAEYKTGSLQNSHLAAALGPTYRDAGGVLRCGSETAPIDGCVPLDLFGGPGSITPDMQRWLSYSGTRRGSTEQALLSISATGELVTLAAKRAVSLAVGYELRRERGANNPDPLTAAGDTTGGQEAATNGYFTVNEAYAELVAPIVGGVAGVDELELSAAARGFSYDTFGAGAIYKFGLRWRLVKGLTLRGTLSSAFRAPAIAELYSGRTDSFMDTTDPCSTLDGPRSELAQKNCQAQGVPDELEEDRSQLRAIWGGNVDLTPERARTFTVGTVYEPRRGLSFTVDYYRIAITNAVAQLGSDEILNGCYLSETPEYCDRIHRDSNGFITRIDDPNTNVGGNSTAGVDVGARYDFPSRVGKWRLNVDLNWLHEFVQVSAGGREVDGKGNYDLMGVYPALRAIGGVDWSRDAWSAGLRGRWVGGFQECENNQCNVQDPDPAVPVNARAVDSYIAFDLFASWELKSGAGATTFTLGVNNLLDADPIPIWNGQYVKTDPSSYDFLGRYLFARVSHAL